MEPKSPEKQLVKLQEVQLGQEFLLFDPLYTKAGPKDDILFERKFALILGAIDLPELHLRSEIFPLEYYVRLEAPFLPFKPETGYVVTNEDFNPTARKKKHVAIGEQNALNPEHLKGEYVLLIGGYMFEKKFPAETIGKLNRLRIRLSIGHMLLEGKRTKLPKIEEAGKIPLIEFSTFYPGDAGELAPNLYGERGQTIYLPDSIDKLSQIRAKIFLADQEPVEMEG